MTDENYQELKEEYVKNLNRFISDHGGIFPHIAVMGSHKDPKEAKDGIIHIQVPDKFLGSEKLKDLFVDQILPKIALKVNEVIVPGAVAWTSEAWLRSVSKDEEVPDNWRELPIQKEVLIISMEFGEKTETLIYEIKRDGKQVNSEGDLVDKVELEALPDLQQAEAVGGRFTGLLKKFVL